MRASSHPSRRVIPAGAPRPARRPLVTGFRSAMQRLGLVFETAPEHVVARLQQLGLLSGTSPHQRRAVVLAAHFGYGTAAGAVAGVLRREHSGPATEAAVGAALGVLMWGAGWSFWLPLLGVNPAPWNWTKPTVLLPIIDHAAYGAAWALTYTALRTASRQPAPTVKRPSGHGRGGPLG